MEEEEKVERLRWSSTQKSRQQREKLALRFLERETGRQAKKESVAFGGRESPTV